MPNGVWLAGIMVVSVVAAVGSKESGNGDVKTKRIRILVVAALTLALVLTMADLGIFFACAPGSWQYRQQPVEPAYVSPYDWTNLIRRDGRFAYEQNGAVVSRFGIDVSEHQGVIDWDAVANDGVTFAFIRLGNRGYTEGGLQLDAQYSANIEGAQAAGIEVGVYFFSQAINEDEAREEAEFVLEHLGGRPLDYPVVYDFEPVGASNGRANRLSPQQVTSNARAFCERIETDGYSTMVYGNAGDLARYGAEFLATHEVWYAEYDAMQPNGQFDFVIWQFTSNGSIAGITPRVDLNIQFIAPGQ
jgi:GH25 family lysozyme M1 (1,4-beta-N-acetylmuramidase)